MVDLEIAPLVGPEILAGSTRLKAGTATKMILNMISTGAMIRIGKTFGNRMVDLRPTNEKLRIRSRRILRELAGIDDDEATEWLARCDGRLKTAPGGVDRGHNARRGPERLSRVHGGQVRAGARREGGFSVTGRPRYVLGVDGGGSSTVAWVADEEGGSSAATSPALEHQVRRRSGRDGALDAAIRRGQE